MRRLLLLVVISCMVWVMIAQERVALNLSEEGWRLWYDSTAVWQTDEFYPGKVDVASLPVRIPTEDWEVLTSDKAIAVQVSYDSPTTGVTSTAGWYGEHDAVNFARQIKVPVWMTLDFTRHPLFNYEVDNCSSSIIIVE